MLFNLQPACMVTLSTVLLNVEIARTQNEGDAQQSLPDIDLKKGEIPAIVSSNRKWSTTSNVGKIWLDIPQVIGQELY